MRRPIRKKKGKKKKKQATTKRSLVELRQSETQNLQKNLTMDGEEEGGPRLSKRFSDKGGEVDFKTKSGTAWSHSYLNQKPWHPLSYPNQRRKWIAEQTHVQRQRRAKEISREVC